MDGFVRSSWRWRCGEKRGKRSEDGESSDSQSTDDESHEDFGKGGG